MYIQIKSSFTQKKKEKKKKRSFSKKLNSKSGEGAKQMVYEKKEM